MSIKKNILVTLPLIFLLSLVHTSTFAQATKSTFGKSNSGQKLKKRNRKVKRATYNKRTSGTITRQKEGKASNILREANRYLGTKYRYGGTSPQRGFDCSGLVQYVYEKIGRDLPRSSREQAKEGKKVSKRDAVQGDLAFFGRGSRITHVGIITSDPNKPLTMIHASSKGVTITNIESSNYWRSRLKFIKRVL